MKLYMKKTGTFISAGATALVLPMMAHAQEFGEIGEFFENLSTFIQDTLIPLAFAVALVVFLYGVIKYFIAGGANEDKRKEGTQLMIYSIIGFVLMVSIWGIVNIVSGAFGLEDSADTVDIPNVPSN